MSALEPGPEWRPTRASASASQAAVSPWSTKVVWKSKITVSIGSGRIMTLDCLPALRGSAD